MTTIALSKTFGERARSFLDFSLRKIFGKAAFENLDQARAAAARAKIHQASGMLASITDGHLGTQPDSPCADKYKTFVAYNASINRAEIYDVEYHHTVIRQLKFESLAKIFGILVGPGAAVLASKTALYTPQWLGMSAISASGFGIGLYMAYKALEEHNNSEAAKLREGIVHGNIRILDERAKAEAAATPDIAI